jgi:GTPase SAR1 family protein
MGTTFIVWDMGGQDKVRVLWRYYYEGVQAIIYVIDSSDRARLPEAKNELHSTFHFSTRCCFASR